MKNGKCRMHGGASTGPKTVEGRARIAAARTIHGGYGTESRAFQAKIAGIKRRGRVLCAFARSELSFAAVAPLLREVQAIGIPGEPGDTKTPCAQKKRGRTQSGTTTNDAMQALMTIELSAKQATALTHLIRDASSRRQPARKRERGRENPVRPETQPRAPAVVAPPQAPRHAAPAVNTPYTQKPNRAARRKMAAQQRASSKPRNARG